MVREGEQWGLIYQHIFYNIVFFCHSSVLYGFFFSFSLHDFGLRMGSGGLPVVVLYPCEE